MYFSCSNHAYHIVLLLPTFSIALTILTLVVPCQQNYCVTNFQGMEKSTLHMDSKYKHSYISEAGLNDQPCTVCLKIFIVFAMTTAKYLP